MKSLLIITIFFLDLLILQTSCQEPVLDLTVVLSDNVQNKEIQANFKINGSWTIDEETCSSQKLTGKSTVLQYKSEDGLVFNQNLDFYCIYNQSLVYLSFGNINGGTKNWTRKDKNAPSFGFYAYPETTYKCSDANFYVSYVLENDSSAQELLLMLKSIFYYRKICFQIYRVFSSSYIKLQRFLLGKSNKY
ncbi:hypothetical protein Ciccas_002523 [Cichlidogyrus casuarinus]|uniref:Transmembrane protein n=1 Tax=Cichlidogyrus casuarinus TaxID=1844966 RepID=A0ABD2QGZ8_9PLAT